MSGTVGINERSAEREVAERERSSKRTESAAHAAKACCLLYNLYTLHFSEAKRDPGPGTSRLDFGGNPMTFLSLPHFHPDDQSWSLYNVYCTLYSRPYIEHCRVESTVYTVSQKRRLHLVIFAITLSTSNLVFIIFGNLILYEICNKVMYSRPT